MKYNLKLWDSNVTLLNSPGRRTTRLRMSRTMDHYSPATQNQHRLKLEKRFFLPSIITPARGRKEGGIENADVCAGKGSLVSPSLINI